MSDIKIVFVGSIQNCGTNKIKVFFKDIFNNDIQIDLRTGDVVYSQTNYLSNALKIYSKKGIVKITEEKKPEYIKYYIGYTQNEIDNKKFLHGLKEVIETPFMISNEVVSNELPESKEDNKKIIQIIEEKIIEPIKENKIEHIEVEKIVEPLEEKIIEPIKENKVENVEVEKIVEPMVEKTINPIEENKVEHVEIEKIIEPVKKDKVDIMEFLEAEKKLSTKPEPPQIKKTEEIKNKENTIKKAEPKGIKKEVIKESVKKGEETVVDKAIKAVNKYKGKRKTKLSPLATKKIPKKK